MILKIQLFCAKSRDLYTAFVILPFTCSIYDKEFISLTLENVLKTLLAESMYYLLLMIVGEMRK